MKLKYYLRGLGIGIICTAIIMGIALSGSKKETLTDTEIIERARLLGMVMEEDTEEPDDTNSSDVRNPINEKKKDVKDKESGNSEETETEDKQEKEEQKSKEDKPENEPKSQTEGTGSKSQEMVQIEIKTGEYSDVISQKLFQAGLISDAEGFNRYLTQKGADDSLSVGVYQIPKGATQDEIIQILQENSQ